MQRRIGDQHLWDGRSILDSDPRQMNYIAESLKMELQHMQRTKRQNCGNNGWGCIHGGISNSFVHSGLQPLFQGRIGALYSSPNSSNFEFGEHSSCSDRMLGHSIHDLKDSYHMGRSVSIQASFLPDGAVGNSSSVGTERRLLGKRKSPLEGSISLPGFMDSCGYVESSFGESVARFSSRSDPTSIASLSSSMVSVPSAPHYSLGEHQVGLQQSSSIHGRGSYRQQQALRQPHLQPCRAWTNRSILASRAPCSRRLLASEQIAVSLRNLNVESNFISNTTNQFDNRRYMMGDYLEEASVFQTQRETVRSNMCVVLTNGTSSWLRSTVQPNFEHMGGYHLGNTTRHLSVRNSRLQAENGLHHHFSTLPSNRHSEFSLFPSVMSSSAMHGGPQISAADSYLPFGSLHRGNPPSTFFFGADETPYLNDVQMPLHGSILPAEIGTHHRFASHESSNHSLGYNRLDVHDQHSDMRLDVDNMTYEELLALEERIGTVSTGLTDGAIMKCMKILKYCFSDGRKTALSEDNDIKCSICQEEYMEDNEIGQLNCGHNYHAACIRQWLSLKNLCPICKAIAHS